MSDPILGGGGGLLPADAPNAAANLADVLERVLDKGVVIAGDIKINLLDIELLTIKLRLLIASVDKAKEMGIDWWEHDPTLSSRATRAVAADPTRPAEGHRRGAGDPTRGADRDRHMGAAAVTGDRKTYTYAVARAFDPAILAEVRGVHGADVHSSRSATWSPWSVRCRGWTSPRTALRANLERLRVAGDRSPGPITPWWTSSTLTPSPCRSGWPPSTTATSGWPSSCDVRTGLLQAALDRLVGRVEMGVKVYADPSAGQPGGQRRRQPGQGVPAPTPGRSCARATSPGRGPATAAQPVDAALAELAVDRRHAPASARAALRRHGPESCSTRRTWSRRDLLGEFAARARALDARTADVRIEVTGPWAAYSFLRGRVHHGRRAVSRDDHRDRGRRSARSPARRRRGPGRRRDPGHRGRRPGAHLHPARWSLRS